MLVKDKHTQCYDEIIKNGSLKSYFFLFIPGNGGKRFSILDSASLIRDSGFRFANSGFGIPLR